MKYCGKCQQWIGDNEFSDHMKQENIGLNSDATEHKQYIGSSKSKGEDYMICVLHQKKTPCPVKGCRYRPFGMIKKSLMMAYFRKGVWYWQDRYGNAEIVDIDTEKRTVVLFGVTIHIRV